MHEDTYVDLITKIYTTLDVKSINLQIMEFHLVGQKHQLTYSSMHHIFGFKKDKLCDPLPNFILNKFWTFLTDLQIPF